MQNQIVRRPTKHILFLMEEELSLYTEDNDYTRIMTLLNEKDSFDINWKNPKNVGSYILSYFSIQPFCLIIINNIK